MLGKLIFQTPLILPLDLLKNIFSSGFPSFALKRSSHQTFFVLLIFGRLILASVYIYIYIYFVLVYSLVC